MKRWLMLAALAAAIIVSFCTTATAENQTLSIKYVPRTQRGTLFYLDVGSPVSMSAAVFELYYDASSVEYRDVSGDDDDVSVRASTGDGVVRIAYCHTSAGSGRLFRVAFKALRAGDVCFSLHMSQAVDEKLNYLTGISDCALDIKLGKEDVFEYSSSGSSKNTSSSEKKKAVYSGSDSRSNTKDPAVNGSEDEVLTDTDGFDFRDISPNDHTRYILIGGSVVILAGLLVTAGYYIGRRVRKRKDVKDAPSEDHEPVLSEDRDLPSEDEPQSSRPDVFKDIE